MLTLSIPILAWFVFLALYAILAVVSMLQMFRHGNAGPMAFVSTFIFVAVALVIMALVTIYIMQVDWSTPISMPTGALTPFVTP